MIPHQLDDLFYAASEASEDYRGWVVHSNAASSVWSTVQSRCQQACMSSLKADDAFCDALNRWLAEAPDKESAAIAVERRFGVKIRRPSEFSHVVDVVAYEDNGFGEPATEEPPCLYQPWTINQGHFTKMTSPSSIRRGRA